VGGANQSANFYNRPILEHGTKDGNNAPTALYILCISVFVPDKVYFIVKIKYAVKISYQN